MDKLKVVYEWAKNILALIGAVSVFCVIVVGAYYFMEQQNQPSTDSQYSSGLQSDPVEEAAPEESVPAYTPPPVRRLKASEFPCSKLVIGPVDEQATSTLTQMIGYCKKQVAELKGIATAKDRAQHLANEYCKFAATYSPDAESQWHASVLDNVYASQYGYATVAYPDDKSYPVFDWHQAPHNGSPIYFDGSYPSVYSLATKTCASDFVDPNAPKLSDVPNGRG